MLAVCCKAKHLVKLVKSLWQQPHLKILAQSCCKCATVQTLSREPTWITASPFSLKSINTHGAVMVPWTSIKHVPTTYFTHTHWTCECVSNNNNQHKTLPSVHSACLRPAPQTHSQKGDFIRLNLCWMHYSSSSGAKLRPKNQRKTRSFEQLHRKLCY